MSKMSRVEMLELFAEQEPQNPFNWYALALEYKELNKEKAEAYFSKLLESFPDYLPTYYQSAEFFAEMNLLPLANSIYLKGIALAETQKEANTLRELKNSYQNFLFEYDFEED